MEVVLINCFIFSQSELRIVKLIIPAMGGDLGKKGSSEESFPNENPEHLDRNRIDGAEDIQKKWELARFLKNI